jgi:quercetin dioxygenase-like cupin family protein
MRSDVVPSTGPGWHWLVNADLEPGAQGMVAVVALPTGAWIREHAFVNAETVSYVIAGGGLWDDLPLGVGQGIHNPPGSRRAFRATEYTILLEVYGDSTRPAELRLGAVTSDGTPVGGVADRTSDRNLAEAGGFADMDVTWLATTPTTGAGRLVLATSRFTPGGSHEPHRHPNAGEFFLVLAGGGEHLTDDGPVRLDPGGFVYVPPDEWHGFRTDDGTTTDAVYGYLGVGSLAEAGYELRGEKAWHAER